MNAEQSRMINETLEVMEIGLVARTGLSLQEIREVTRGQQRARAGLTRSDALTIRDRHKSGLWTQAQLANIYDVHPSTVSRIVNLLMH